MNTLRRILCFSLFVPIFMLIGCAALMPSGSQQSYITAPRWNSYDQFAESSAKIILGQTTLAQMKESGFDPKVLPNTEVIKDVRLTLLPRKSDSVELLPKEAQACYRNFMKCVGFAFIVERVDTRGEGSVALRVVNIKKKDIMTGWQAKFDVYVLARKYIEDGFIDGTLNGEDQIVVFMLLGGKPNIQQVNFKNTPLGPLDTVIGAGKRMSPVGVPDFNTD